MIGTILTLAAAAFVTMFVLSLCRIAWRADGAQEKNRRDYAAGKKRTDEAK